ncbi:TM2 domain-containing protein [Brachyspira pilosicoli]|uniref:TM2 domain-containing protein n=5 Tax=Brachyspira pilosicoli TaxID=52584 RepID=D8IC66_BRAP9|nr:TM2 domain-containing protein [Brachyspira pilosicoli]ADK30739.1 TM2 domain-containing protein [Brachyspira pilosicoli 95/1000]AGA67441.1 TM2 domain-containing protein [Brachyspira pilosicoli P43/6/78]MBW5381773.1 TM2 domain-containing protein [Brachyspira pilosicoli]MBW5392562.1 TM2 domain-containing protein [Brachyspira pilosicoli]PLV57936.1 membrane protein [Brachyspira pilosicoli SP16]
MKKRAYAIVYSALSIMLGGIGIQKFYLGQTKRGILHVLFFWTFIPTILCVIDLLKFTFMTEEEFDEKYNKIELNNNLSNGKKETNIIKQALKYNKLINTASMKITDNKIKENIKELNEIYKNIIDISVKDTTNNKIAAKELEKLLEYNIPTIVKIINTYIDLEKSKIEEDNDKLKNDITDSIIAMKENLKTILNTIYKSNIIDISSDIEVIKSTLKK